MKLRTVIGFVTVVGIWYGVGYFQGYLTGYDLGIVDGMETTRRETDSEKSEQ